MNYTKKKYDEARRRFIDGQPWDKIVEVFATVPQVTLEEANEMHNRYLSTKNGLHNADRDFLDAVNYVLAKQGPVIAAKPKFVPTDMVSLEDVEKALGPVNVGNAEWLAHIPGTRKGMNVASAYEITDLLRDRLSLLCKSKPEPTVTLVDAAEGRTLEVPASAVHEMEYPEAVTYTRDPWTGKDMCNLCGVYVVDKVTHAAFHGRMEGK